MVTFLRYILLLVLTGFASACNDDDTPPPEQLPDPDPPEIPFRLAQSPDATLQATYFSRRVDSGLIGRITYFQGIAFAGFVTQNGSLTSPRKVVAEGSELEPVKGIFTNSPGQTQGLDFGSIVEWEIDGHGNIPDFSEDIMSAVPEIGNINIRDSINSDEVLQLVIDTKSPYTNLGQLDSVNYLIIGKKNSLARKTGSLDTVTFSPQEIFNLGLGTAYIQVEAFRYETRTYSNYQVRFLNKGVFNKRMWIY